MLLLKTVEQVRAACREARARGGAVLISSHQLETIDDLCDRVGILKDGVISELGKGESQAVWMLRAGGGEGWGEIIGGCGGEDVGVHENVWTFSASRGEKAVPAIINSLVSAGCEIYEVRRVDGDFSAAIRNIYKDNDRQ
ncbi:MAG: hypothetical protein LBH93_03710 [Chitinispirillales bacterium]|jgi:ABC-type multidrug transport system ATPase subunit|nr:hypothetical protein [Chitinispirillales bacterium]